MSARHPKRLLIVAVLLTTLIGIATMTIMAVSHFKRQANVRAKLKAQDSAVSKIRGCGGAVLLGPSKLNGLPPDVVSIELQDAVIDAALMQTIAQFTTIERLTLDKSELHPNEFAWMRKLVQLRTLSLSETTIDNKGVANLPLNLTTLSLNGTKITDESITHILSMNSLERISKAF